MGFGQVLWSLLIIFFMVTMIIFMVVMVSFFHLDPWESTTSSG